MSQIKSKLKSFQILNEQKCKMTVISLITRSMLWLGLHYDNHTHNVSFQLIKDAPQHLDKWVKSPLVWLNYCHINELKQANDIFLPWVSTKRIVLYVQCSRWCRIRLEMCVVQNCKSSTLLSNPGLGAHSMSSSSTLLNNV